MSTDNKNQLITLLIADDHPALRAGLRILLEKAPDIQVVGEAQESFEVQRLVARLKPRILLLDLKMPGFSPAELEKWIRQNYPETNTLVLTAHDRDAYLAGMMEAGAVGYFDKKECIDRLIDAIRRAAEGEVLFDEKQLARVRLWREKVARKWERLTARECEVLNLLARGINNKAIARALFISPKTVEFHITHILEKLALASRQEAETWVLSHSPIDFEEDAG
jgi:DNA-binding NarL/FixJ family response regulator